jgi:hypothetical protein
MRACPLIVRVQAEEALQVVAGVEDVFAQQMKMCQKAKPHQLRLGFVRTTLCQI